MTEIKITDINHLIQWFEKMRSGTRVHKYLDFPEFNPSSFRITTDQFTLPHKTKVIHFSFLLNWSYLTLLSAIRRGMWVIISEKDGAV